jgi:DnaK suppressor protein
MNKKDTEHFRQLLLKKRKELTDQMDFIKEVEMETTLKEATGDHSSYSFHMADQGTDAAEREKNFYYAQRDGRLLYHIEQALERIEKGEFGLCVGCGKPIHYDRLDAVPHARLCIKCKSGEEIQPEASDMAEEAE